MDGATEGERGSSRASSFFFSSVSLTTHPLTRHSPAPLPLPLRPPSPQSLQVYKPPEELRVNYHEGIKHSRDNWSVRKERKKGPPHSVGGEEGGETERQSLLLLSLPPIASSPALRNRRARARL